MFEIPCVILCGGKSSRMGEDKSLLPFGNSKSLFLYQYDRLKPYFKNIFLSSKNNKFFLKDEKKLILDNSENFSPIVALNSIFLKLNNFDKVFIITVDNPFVKIQSIGKIVENSNASDICVAKTSRVHNLCGVFDVKKSKSIVEDMIKNDIHKVGFLLKNLKTKEILFDDEEEFLNINHKYEYEESLKIINKTYNN